MTTDQNKEISYIAYNHYDGNNEHRLTISDLRIRKMNKFDLEERLIEFSVLIIEITKDMPSNYASNHLAKQLLRSGTSVSLNYGEVQSGESRKDFVHKLKVVLKELRETLINLKIIERTGLYSTHSLILKAKRENNELISIFVKSIETAQKNMQS